MIDRNTPDTHEHETNRTDMSRRTLLWIVGATGLATPLLAGMASADDATITRLAANVKQVEKPTRIREYPTYDADGTQTGQQTWRVVRGTGNCCENYIAADADGAIYDAGGKYVFTSPDDGKTWKRVAPSTPWPATAEGCVSTAPNGDICAIDWNPYSGDRLVAYKCVATEKTWYYNEVPLHTPFYDRPWFAVLEGPFTIAGIEVPYVTIMKGGYPSSDAVLYISLDGLTYELASNRALDAAVNGSIETYLDGVPADSDLDLTQPHTKGHFVPLSEGQALTDETALAARAGFTEVGCDRVLLRDDPDTGVNWYCFDTLADLSEGRLLADSRGYLHQINFETPDTFAYRYSTDGGQTWERYRQELPENYELRSEMLWDFKAHGELATTAVAVHATDPEENADQDMVFRFTGVEPESAPDREILYLGMSKVSYVVGVSTAERFDFTTLAILPDGRVAVSYADSESSNPRLAIEAPGKTPDGPPLDLQATRSDDGDAFTGGQTNDLHITVTPDRDAVIRDVIPEEWDVLEAYSEDVGHIEHRNNAGITYVYFRETAPAGEQTAYTYLAEAPSGTSNTGTYTFGPVEGRPVNGAAWVTAPGSTDTNAVVGSDTNT
jgi:hypothetical protein